MTKNELINAIAKSTEIKKATIDKTIEAFLETIIHSMEGGKNVYLRGFGSFVIKKRARKSARNFSNNTSFIIPAHVIPSFKASKSFILDIRSSKKKKTNLGIDNNSDVGVETAVLKKAKSRRANEFNEPTLKKRKPRPGTSFPGPGFRDDKN